MLLEQRVMREAHGEKGQKSSDSHPADFKCFVHVASPTIELHGEYHGICNLTWPLFAHAAISGGAASGIDPDQRASRLMPNNGQQS